MREVSYGITCMANPIDNLKQCMLVTVAHAPCQSENQVQFANISEVSIQDFNKEMDQLENAQLIVIHIHLELPRSEAKRNFNRYYNSSMGRDCPRPGKHTVSWSQNFNWHQKRGIQGNLWTLTFLPRCAKNEEHASIASINDLVASVLQEVCISGISSHYSPVDLRLDLELFHCIEGHIPLRQTGLTLPILEQDETNHRWYLKFGPPQTYIFEPHAAGYATAHMLSKVHKSTASLPLGVRKQITSQGPWYKTVWHSCPRLSCSTESCEAF